MMLVSLAAVLSQALSGSFVVELLQKVCQEPERGGERIAATETRVGISSPGTFRNFFADLLHSGPQQKLLKVP